MDLALSLLVAAGLSMDSLAVAVACASSRSHKHGDGLRLAASFGFFQFAMAAAGWLAGATFRSLFAAVDHWAAFGVLIYIGGKMALSGLSGREENECAHELTRRRLVALSLATSIDAFAVGMGFAFLDTDFLLTTAIIGGVTFAITFAGAALGSRISKRWGSIAETAGGLTLMLIGTKILADHML
jgi:manganese efflux pump family protein